MGREIERKYLVTGNGWRGKGPGVSYRQGYLSLDPDRTVRVRSAGGKGYLTIKGRSEGLGRSEFEYEIPQADADAMLEEMCRHALVEKTRYRIEHAGLTWEIDEFAGANAGLVLAEVELETEDQDIALPEWVGLEVSGDPRYYNASLAQKPYRNW